jgi:stress-induced morphogen
VLTRKCCLFDPDFHHKDPVCFQEVVDESDGCGGKFSCVVVSEKFRGKPLIQRHRLVNSALQEELKTIHAFSQKTFTPEQWKEQNS